MMFQGASVFPTQSAQLATALINCLRRYPTGAEAFEVLADLITDPVSGRFLHGHNADELTRKQVNALIESEHLRLAGNFEALYETKEKYNGHKARVMEDVEFRRDWRTLKQRFPKDLLSGKIVLRSKANDGNRIQNMRPPRPPRFQDVFDFFCWKWFLEGMDGDEPIVTRLSFDVTPLGTTIFIPGYWSFDPKRDIKWRELLKFHRSRGVKRQGEAFEPNRRDRENKERIFLQADQISHARGEHGEALLERCIRMANLPPNTDRTYIYRVLAEAKRNQIGAQPSAHQETLSLEEDSQTVAVPGVARIKATVKKTPRTGRAKQTAR
jgi:hypothetical protein